MKKYIIVGTLALILIMPMIGASEKFSTESTEIIDPSATFESTHTVLIEYVGQTTCGYCPTASNQLSSIYAAGDLDFYYVSMIVDVNRRVYPRVQELGVTGTPDVYFDGGYRNINGAQVDEQPYRNAIIQSGEREVPDIDIDVDVQWIGGGTLKISVTVTNNEALINIDAFRSIESIGGFLNISDNSALENLNGLKNLSTIGGQFYLLNNDSLKELTGLSSLTSIGEEFSISGNRSLQNLDGINGLVSVGLDLHIENNCSLSNLFTETSSLESGVKS